MEEANCQFLGVDKDGLQEFKNVLDDLLIRSEEFLIKVTDKKFDVRNFCCWLNKAVIKTIQENEVEIENLKFDMNQYKFNMSRLLNFISSDF